MLILLVEMRVKKHIKNFCYAAIMVIMLIFTAGLISSRFFGN